MFSAYMIGPLVWIIDAKLDLNRPGVSSYVSLAILTITKKG